MVGKRKRRKALLSGVLAFCMSFSGLMPATVWAETNHETMITETIELEWVETELPELELGAKSLSMFALDANGNPELIDGTSLDWYGRLAELPEYAQQMYAWLIENSDGDSIEDEENPCGTDVLIDPAKGEMITSGGNQSYVYKIHEFVWEIPFSNLKGADDEATKAAIRAYVSEQLSISADENYEETIAYTRAVYEAFDKDYPEVFWLSGSRSVGYSASYSYSYDGTGSGTGTCNHYV